MNMKNFFKPVLLLIFSLLMFFIPASAEESISNSLVQISVEKPVDNSCRLGLYFKDKFDSNAFVQKVKNGVFQVFIPDTEAAARNVKIMYKGRIKPSDVKITINELPYEKDGAKSKCIRLSVETPVNFDIQLTAQTFTPDKKYNIEIGGPFMSIFTIAAAILLIVSAVLLASIIKTARAINTSPESGTAFPEAFLRSPKDYAERGDDEIIEEPGAFENSSSEQPQQISSRRGRRKTSPISSAGGFSCFDLQPEASAPRFSNYADYSAQNNQPQQNRNLEMPAIDEKAARAKVSKPQTEHLMPAAEAASELSMKSAEEYTLDSSAESGGDFGPELISELKIGADKGFYLTKAAGAYALFGYSSENIFFLQKFNKRPLSDLKAKFYDRKFGRDIYIVSLDNYKAAVSVSDSEIKELAPV